MTGSVRWNLVSFTTSPGKLSVQLHCTYSISDSFSHSRKERRKAKKEPLFFSPSLFVCLFLAQFHISDVGVS